METKRRLDMSQSGDVVKNHASKITDDVGDGGDLMLLHSEADILSPAGLSAPVH